MWKLCPPLKFLATPLPALVVGEENLVISFGLPPPTLEMLSPSLPSTEPMNLTQVRKT